MNNNQKSEKNKKEPTKQVINPLSLVKFFYENDVEDIAAIQKLIYLTFFEILKKENILLDFGENFQVWPRGPILEKVFFDMMRCWEKHGNYEKLLNKIPFPGDEKITRYCREWAFYYHKIEKEKQHYKLSERSQNQPWIIARNKVGGYLENERIELTDIINFARQERKYARV